MILNSLRYLGMRDFPEIRRMTLYEYNMRMKAFRLQQVDRDYDLHLLAWESWNVQAMKKQGKNKTVPVFKTFKQFFDYEARLKGAYDEKEKKDPKVSNIIIGMRELEERRRRDGEL